MAEMTIQVGRELFRFRNYQEWVNKAPAKFDRCQVMRPYIICVDTKGRVCALGIDFVRARDDKSVPVRAYSLELK
jgi:hypothetical protein